MPVPTPRPDPLLPGQQSVWAFPRPAIARPCAFEIRIVHRGVVIACTTRAVMTLETSHPPSYYIPRAEIDMSLLTPTPRRSLCEWKGEARYFTLSHAGEVLTDVAWSYERPAPGFESLAGHLAFYPEPFEGCFVDGERATPQAGGFYGGWITSHFAGPFKGGPGTRGW